MRALSHRRIWPYVVSPLIVLNALYVGSAAAGTLRYTEQVSPAQVRLSRSGTATAVSVDAAGYYTLGDAGSPALPYRIVRLLLPPGETVGDFETAVGQKHVVFESYEPAIAPVSGDPEQPAQLPLPRLTTNPAGEPFPGTPVRYLGTGFLHGQAIASFAVFPLHALGSTLTLHESITLTVNTVPRTGGPEVAAPLRLTPARRDEITLQISTLVDNPQSAVPRLFPAAEKPTGPFSPTSAPSLEGSPVDYLIITTDALAPSFQRLADWKTAKGVPTVIRTTEWIATNNRRGVDLQETIRFFIRDAYQKWGVKWVLLGGDTPEIPARHCWSTYYFGGRFVPVDLYYAGLDGSWNADHDDVWGEAQTVLGGDDPDLYADVYLGRLTVSTPGQVDDVIDKIISYTTPLDPTYLNKAMFMAEVLFPYPWNPGDDIQVNGADTAEYIFLNNPSMQSMDIVRAYETDYLYPGSIHESRDQAIDSLNAGFNIVNHVGHGFRFNMHVGDDNVVIADADTLSNADRYCNLYMLNCTAVAFDYDCLGEHFLKNASGGAVSIIGASNSAFPDASVHYMDEYTRLVFGQGVRNVGEAFHRSRLPRTGYAELSDNSDFWTHYIYALLADPEMPLWTGPVSPLVVGFPDTVQVGLNTIQVDVSSGGAPAGSVLVCLWKDAEDYQTGVTDASGTASFEFACASPGSVSVVATSPSHGRYQGWITVLPAAAAYLTVDSLYIDDTAAGQVFGNGNGVLDAAETVYMYPVVRNTGGSAAGELILTLRTDSPVVGIPDSLGFTTPIAAGSAVVAVDPWRIDISDTVPDQTAIRFEVSLQEPGGGTWTGSFARLIHAPSIEFVSIRKDDSPPYGNGNGVVEDGEQFRLFASVKNYGWGEATGLTATVRDLAGGVTVTDSTDVYADLSRLDQGENADGWVLSEISTAVENPVEITVVDELGRSVADTVEFRRPYPPSSLEFDTGLGADKILLWWTGSASADVDRYKVYRSMTSGGPYEVANIDLTEHTVFTDEGLMAATRYYYVVAAVDRSGNESTVSAEASASTNPPQLAGWPMDLPDASTNSPSVGDIDGDGDLEVVIGNDKLYAWHHDGLELRDGDSDQSTWGVFSDQGQDFIGPAALARLDGVPGLDIVAASYSTKQLFCFNYTGAVLPGWPQPTQYNVRASVAVGDLDGDNLWEIVAVDQEAVIHAWHADGSEVRDGDGNPATTGVFRVLTNTPWIHYQSPAMYDVDGDGNDEIIINDQDSTLYVMDGSGNDLPGWPVRLPGLTGGSVAVGDIDNDGDAEIVVSVRSAFRTIAFHHDATQMWVKWFSQNMFFTPSPALADLTGDGMLETILPSSSGTIHVITHNGQDLAGWPVYYSTSTYTESSPIVADVNGDGAPDVLLGDESRFISAWDAAGNPLDGFPLATRDAVRGVPTATDLDGDGDVEVIAAGFDRVVYTWDIDQAYNPAASHWPEFHANSHRNGFYGYEVPTAAPDGDRAPVVRAGLEQNFPNPFNPVTTIRFHVPANRAGRVSLVVYDVSGARIRTILDSPLPAGTHTRRWDGTDLHGNRVSSGVYFYRLEMPGLVDTRKMVLLK